MLLRSADLRHRYETYRVMTKDLPRENVRLLDEILELKPEKPNPVGPVDNLGVDTSLDLTFTDVTESEKKLLMFLDESEDDIHTSDAAGHNDNSYPLSYDTSGGGQPMLSQTAWVTHKSFSSPVRIVANSVINSMTRRGLYGLVKPLLMQTCNLKQASVKDKCAISPSAILEAIQSQGLPMFDLSPVGSFGAKLRPECYQRTRTHSMAHIIEPESALLREGKSDHLEYQIRYAHLYMVECQDARLPDEKYACWKKRGQKVPEL